VTDQGLDPEPTVRDQRLYPPVRMSVSGSACRAIAAKRAIGPATCGPPPASRSIRTSSARPLEPGSGARGVQRQVIESKVQCRSSTPLPARPSLSSKQAIGPTKRGARSCQGNARQPGGRAGTAGTGKQPLKSWRRSRRSGWIASSDCGCAYSAYYAQRPSRCAR
jgi:hypothetical protein